LKILPREDSEVCEGIFPNRVRALDARHSPRKIKIRAAHEIMAARTAQLAFLVDQLVPALRTKPPVVALKNRGALFRTSVSCSGCSVCPQLRNIRPTCALIWLQQFVNRLCQRIMPFLRKVQAVQCSAFQRKRLSQVTFRYQCHIVFLGQTPLSVSEGVAEWREWQFKHDNLIVSFFNHTKEFVEFDIKGLPICPAQ
jgi:hypothetical protein